MTNPFYGGSPIGPPGVSGVPDGAITVGAVGADFTTITEANAAASDGDTILIYPGTYTETITIANWSLTFIGVGSPDNVIVTQADANVVNFGGYTGTVFRNIHFRVTAATTAIATVTGALGTATFENCKVSMTSSAAIAAALQPSCGRLTSSGELRLEGSTFVYAHTGNGGGTAIKSAFVVANAGLVHLNNCKHCTVTNSGTALASAVVADQASSGNAEVIDCEMTVTDPNATVLAGIAYISGTGTSHEFRRNELHAVATANTGHALYTAATVSIVRSMFNHYHVVDTGGTSYGIYVGTSSTVTSQFDDIVADDGNVEDGTLAGAFSDETGDFTVTKTFKSADLGLGQPNVNSHSEAFSGFTAAEAKTYNVTGMWTSNPVIRRLYLWISNDPGADQNLNFILSFYTKDSMTEDERLGPPRYFNLTYTETNGGITATDTTDTVDSGAGLVDGDKVYLMGGTAEIVTLTATPTATGLTFTAATQDHADNTGIVKIYKMIDMIQLYDEDASNEVHMKLECLDTPNASTNVGFWLETQ